MEAPTSDTPEFVPTVFQQDSKEFKLLKFYKDTNPSSLVDEDNPLIDAFDAFNGSWSVQKIYIRNDDPTVWYENVRVLVTLPNGDPVLNGVDSYNSYQLLAGDLRPDFKEWNERDHFQELNLGDIGSPSGGNTELYVPFWLRIYVHGHSKPEIISEVNLSLEAIERII